MNNLKVTNFKLGIGIPLNFPFVHAAFFDSWVPMERPDFTYLRSNNGPIDAMRNDLVVQAQLNGCSHLLMMDTDMVYPPDTIPRLLGRRMPVIGALCYRRYPPFTPLIMTGTLNNFTTISEWVPGELVKVDATGTGCLLFSMEAFETIPPPWFEFMPNPNQDVGGLVGEDIGFCTKLRKAGYEIVVDTGIEIAHLSTFKVNRMTYEIFRGMEEARNEMIKQEKEVSCK